MRDKIEKGGRIMGWWLGGFEFCLGVRRMSGFLEEVFEVWFVLCLASRRCSGQREW